ncbi:MAG: type II secretion system F family protein [Candidatus Paceibacterota bacterium]|jgi:type IV pilus assembly protein PilC
MKYSYQAKDSKGGAQKGVIEAANKDVALEILSKNNLFPLEVKEFGVKETGEAAMSKKITIFGGVSMKDVAMFSRQLAIMIDSNVPPAEAIEALGDQTKNATFKEKIYKISKDVREGVQLSKALGQYPNIFSVFYVNMVKSGEVSGNLPKILEKIADHLESEYEIQSKMMGAMMYPTVILIIFVLIFIVIMIFVIPGLVEVLKGTGQELPFATKLIITLSDFFVTYWYLVLGVLMAIVGFFIYFPKTVVGKDIFDRIALKIPVFGPFLKNLFQARFAENFSTLISAGIPINEALEVVADLVSNNVYRDAILLAKEKVIKGETVSHVFAQQSGIISPLFVQMVAVGEQTGKLDSSLMNVVRFYKRETSIFVDSISSIIEPVLIIGLALMVGFLVAAVLLPIYKISTTLQQ